MGLCSWLTKVDDEHDLEFFKTALQHNPVAYRIHYVLRLTTPVPKLGTGLVVAWSGDGSYSLSYYMPDKYFPPSRTLSLDDLVSAFPAWLQGDGPEKYGTYVPDHKVKGGAGAETWDESAWLRWLEVNPDIAIKVAQREFSGPAEESPWFASL
jgi:hypothetical protein